MDIWGKATGGILAAGGFALGMALLAGTDSGIAAMTWECATVPFTIHESTDSKPQADRWVLLAVATQSELDVAIAVHFR